MSKGWILLLSKFRRLKTLRNQIFFVFLVVFILVLLIISIVTFQVVSNLLKENAEVQIKETTVQVSERLDGLYRQIDMISKQVVMNSFVQQLLLEELEGRSVSFEQRQSIMQVVNSYQAYSDGIHSFELYLTDYRKLYPLNEAILSYRIDQRWIDEATAAKGKLVWIGRDPYDPSLYLAIRQVSIIDRWFSNGGYLLTRVNGNYFRLKDKEAMETENEYMIVDKEYSPVYTDYFGDIHELITGNKTRFTLNERDYIVTKEVSNVTGWTSVILTPVSTLVSGLSVLRGAVLFSGIIGLLIFFISSYFLSTMVTRPIFNLIQTMRIAKLKGLRPISEGAATEELVELNKSYNDLVANTNHLIKVVYEKEILVSQAELKALQAQINPHFLYNTLEALYWSLEEKGEEELADFVVSMSELFRYTIGNSRNDQEWVRVKEELEHVERYLRVMKIRFGERLTWEVAAPPDCDVKIPKLVIQPIVENAILHGVGNKNGPGKITVIVTKTNSLLQFKIIDDGPGIDATKLQSIKKSIQLGELLSQRGNGMALINVNKRLQLYYKNYGEGGLTIESKANQGTCVTIQIPVKGVEVDVE